MFIYSGRLTWQTPLTSTVVQEELIITKYTVNGDMVCETHMVCTGSPERGKRQASSRYVLYSIQCRL